MRRVANGAGVAVLQEQRGGADAVQADANQARAAPELQALPACASTPLISVHLGLLQQYALET